MHLKNALDTPASWLLMALWDERPSHAFKIENVQFETLEETSTRRFYFLFRPMEKLNSPRKPMDRFGYL